jgi:hypothetical protein
VPLSDDQRALLRLLAQREESYRDIAALMGLSVDEVRERVREALEELDEGGSSAASAAAGPVAEETTTPARASRPARSKPRQRPRSPQSRRRLIELVGGALLVVLLVLFATGAVDLGGDSDSDGESGDTAASVAAGDNRLTQATLEPIGGGDATGRALFGRVGENVVLQVVAEGLEPTAPGETYTAWLYRSPKLALRVGSVKVRDADQGRLAARFPVPPEVLALVANGAFKEIDLSLTSDAEYQAEVAQAKDQQRLPRYSGESVLRGPITGPLAESGGAGG